MYDKSNMNTYTTICRREKGICCRAQEKTGALVSAWRGGMGREMGGRFKGEGIMYTYG